MKAIVIKELPSNYIQNTLKYKNSKLEKLSKKTSNVFHKELQKIKQIATGVYYLTQAFIVSQCTFPTALRNISHLLPIVTKVSFIGALVVSSVELAITTRNLKKIHQVAKDSIFSLEQPNISELTDFQKRYATNSYFQKIIKKTPEQLTAKIKELPQGNSSTDQIKKIIDVLKTQRQKEMVKNIVNLIACIATISSLIMIIIGCFNPLFALGVLSIIATALFWTGGCVSFINYCVFKGLSKSEGWDNFNPVDIIPQFAKDLLDKVLKPFNEQIKIDIKKQLT
jgi:hypothetical protein